MSTSINQNNQSIYEVLSKYKGKKIDGIMVSELAIHNPKVIDINHQLLTVEFKKGKHTKTAYIDLNSCHVRAFTVRKSKQSLRL